MTDLSQARVQQALEQADLGTLRLALYQATHDPEIAAMLPEPQTVRGGAGVSYQVPERYRSALVEKGVELLAEGAAPVEHRIPDDHELRRLMEMAGDPLDDAEFAARREIPAFDPFPWAANWTSGRPALPEDFRVVIVGAGFGGIGMAVQLENLGIPYVVLERRQEVGGVWSINTYPGARVDTPSAVYEFSFEKRYPWSEYFAQQPEVRRYIEYVAEKYGVEKNLRLGVTVSGAQFDAASSRWRVHVAGPDGTEETIVANFVISASGLFAAPKPLDVEGIENFGGEIFHTTEWTAERSVAGKQVAVIGNGSTGTQLLDKVSDEARSVTVFQRTPQWISPREHYGAPVSDELRWLMENVPYYWNWSRYTGALSTMNLYGLLTPDPDWQASGGLFSPQNDAVRTFLQQYIKNEVQNRADLVAKLTPQYPPFARRMVVDNGWYRALLKDNVELVTDPIARFVPGGIETETGGRYRVDTVVTATGFSVEKYVWPADYIGLNGVHLHDGWSEEGARAYLGMMVPMFPNFFIMYGPNSQNTSGGGAGLPTQIEIWSKYIGSVIVETIESGCSTVQVEQAAFNEFYDQLDQVARNTIWLIDQKSSGRNYYVNNGHLLVNQPWPHNHWHNMITRPKFSDLKMTA